MNHLCLMTNFAFKSAVSFIVWFHQFSLILFVTSFHYYFSYLHSYTQACLLNSMCSYFPSILTSACSSNYILFTFIHMQNSFLFIISFSFLEKQLIYIFMLVSSMLHDLKFAQCMQMSYTIIVIHYDYDHCSDGHHTHLLIVFAIFFMLYITSSWLIYFITGGLYLLVPFTCFSQQFLPAFLLTTTCLFSIPESVLFCFLCFRSHI